MIPVIMYNWKSVHVFYPLGQGQLVEKVPAV